MAEESFRVKFEADVSGLKQGLQDLTRTAEDTAQAISPDAPKGLGKAAEAAADSLDGRNGSLGQSADKAADALSGGESLEKSADKAADAIENTGKKSDTTAGNVENVGKKAAKAGENFGKAQSAAGNLTGELNKLGSTGIPVVDRLVAVTKASLSGTAGLATAAMAAVGTAITAVWKSWSETKQIRDEIQALAVENAAIQGEKATSGMAAVDQLTQLAGDASPEAASRRRRITDVLNQAYGDYLTTGEDGTVDGLDKLKLRMAFDSRRAALAPIEKEIADAKKALSEMWYQPGGGMLRDNFVSGFFGFAGRDRLEAQLANAQERLKAKQMELDLNDPVMQIVGAALGAINDNFADENELGYAATEDDRREYRRAVRRFRTGRNAADYAADVYSAETPELQYSALKMLLRLAQEADRVNEEFEAIQTRVQDADIKRMGTLPESDIYKGTVQYVDRFGDGQIGHDIHDMAAAMRSGRVLFVNNQGGY